MSGRFCPVCHVETERQGSEYVCPECGRVLVLLRPRPLGWLALAMQDVAGGTTKEPPKKVSEK